MSNVQIPSELFDELLAYFLADIEDWEADILGHRIRHGLQTKLDAQLRRQLFSQYKRAATAEEREAARTAYLDAVGMRESYRSKEPPGEPPDSLSP